MGWLVLLSTSAVWWVTNKKVNPRRGAHIVSIITMLLAAIAGCGLAFTVLGRWLATVVSWAGRTLASIFGEPGIASGFAIGLTLLVLLFAVADIAYDRVADKGAQFAAFFTPTLLALVIGGSLGSTGGAAVESVTSQVASFMTQLGGS